MSFTFQPADTSGAVIPCTQLHINCLQAINQTMYMYVKHLPYIGIKINTFS